MRRSVVAIVTVWSLAGCGRDPILEKAEADAAAAKASRATPGGAGAPAGNPAPGAPGARGGAKGAAAGPGAGVPEEPAPGIPEEPVPGAPGSPVNAVPGSAAPVDPGSPRPGIPTEPKPGIPSEPPPGDPLSVQGPTVKVSGEVVFAGYKAGKVQITAFDGDHSSARGMSLKVVGSTVIDKPGPFSLSVAEGAGKVYLEASVDEDGDGRPGPLDPSGKADRFPVTVGSAAVDGLTVTLEKRAPPPGGRGQDF